MKLIIDIPEDMLEWFKNGEIIDEYDKSALKQVFKNGTPLDDVKEEIQENINYNKRMNYLGIVTGLLLALDIIDYKVGKGSKDFPQAEDIEPTVKGFVDTIDILDRLCKESEET